jgi:hypothetical protein
VRSEGPGTREEGDVGLTICNILKIYVILNYRGENILLFAEG